MTRRDLALAAALRWQECPPARSLVVLSITMTLAGVCVPRGVVGSPASPGPIGGALIGTVCALGALVVAGPLFAFGILTRARRGPVDDALYLSRLGRWRRGGLAVATVTGATGTAIVLAAGAGALAGTGDAVMAGLHTDWAQVPIAVVPGLAAALSWQGLFCLGLAMAFPESRSALTLLTIAHLPVVLMLFWFASDLGSRIAVLTPAGVAFSHLFMVSGDRYFVTTSAHDVLVLAGWQMAVWLAASRGLRGPVASGLGRLSGATRRRDSRSEDPSP